MTVPATFPTITPVPFPGTLPRPQRSGYGYETHRPVAVNAMDRGCGRVRRVGLGMTIKQTLRWVFSDAQLAIWCAFWANDLAAGSIPFSIALINAWADATAIAYPISPFTQTANAGRWTVELSVELADIPRADPATLSDLLAVSVADQTALNQFAAMHTLVNSTIPANIP